MISPTEVQEKTFVKAVFGGYDMESVDEFLEPLTEDYITLYKENALLKSKMRVLVGKLEEYRKNEASMKDAIVNAQKTCDLMVKEAEQKCTQMLSDAGAAAVENSKNADVLIAEENARVEEAKQAAAEKIAALQAQLNECIEALEQIKQANRPAPVKVAPVVAPAGMFYDYDSDPDEEKPDPSDAVADEISANLEALVGTTEDEAAVKAEPHHPNSDTTGKFANLQFGKNYDPKNR